MMHRESSIVKMAGTVLAFGSLLGLLSIGARGQKSQAAEVSAILAKCQQCHGTAVQMSKVSVASREALLQGGAHGPAIVPGHAADSLLYKRITGQEKPAMPMAPVSPLTPDEIAAVKAWIDQGAPWPDGAVAAAPVNHDRDASLLEYNGYHERPVTDADRQWWAFKKPVRP